MKNPFIKQNNNGLWIAAAATGIVAAGAAAWLYFKRKASRSGHNEHALDYLSPEPMLHKKKTDVSDLHVIAAG